MVAFIAFVNGILSWFGGLVGVAELSIELIFGYLFIPLAWLMGVDYEVGIRLYMNHTCNIISIILFLPEMILKFHGSFILGLL